MSKVLIFSDLHIHPHKKNINRLWDCLKVLNWVFDTAEKHSIKDIIFCGDLFHDRSKIDLLTYVKSFEIFKSRVIKDLNFWCLIGNHDMWYHAKWDVNSVSPLSIIPGFHVIDQPSVLEIAGHNCSFLPYTKTPLDYINNIREGEVLFAHLALDGAKLNSFGITSDICVEHDGDMVKVSPDKLSNWKQVFLGHYHVPQLLNEHVEYIGSPLELDFSDRDQEKHIIIYDFEKKEYVVNDFSPKHLVINESQIGQKNLNNNFVIINVQDLGSIDLLEMQQSIKSDYNVASIEINQIVKPVKEKMIVEDATSILSNEDELLENYIKESKSELNFDLLLNIGKDIFHGQI